MAISLKLETREQTYDIYGGSAGFTKIIQATGLADKELTTEKILEAISDLDRRKAIVVILMDEGEFVPDLPDFSTERKKEALILKLAKQLDIYWTMDLVARLVKEIAESATKLNAAIPPTSQPEYSGQFPEHFRQFEEYARNEAIAPQPDLIQEAAIAEQQVPPEISITEGG